jgi:protein AATF/BFR2
VSAELTRAHRYDVHEKIQNFMVPVQLAGGGGWHDAQADELFASLLGRGFGAQGEEEKSAYVGAGAGAGPVQEEIGGMMKGLRVFG